MRRLLICGILLSTAAIPAMAADLAPVVKAPQQPVAPYSDWSSIYIGGAGGYAWGKEKLDSLPASLGDLFGTSTTTIFGGSAVLIQPDVNLRGFSGTRSLNGFVAGGFVGVQKQFGSVVFGLEASFDATGMKKSQSESTFATEGTVKFNPTTTFTVGPLSVKAGGDVVIPGQSIQSSGTLKIPGQEITSNGILTIQGQDIKSTGSITIDGQKIDSTGTLTIPGQTVQACKLAKCSDAEIGPFSLKVPPQDVKVNVTGSTATVTVNVEVNGSTQTVTIPVQVKGQTMDATLPVVVNGQTQSQTVHVEVTGTTGTQDITLKLPAEQKVQANVSRTLVTRTEVDELFDARAKFGVAMGQSWMLYATGGASIGHFTKTVALTQTTSVQGDVTRTDTFSASSGDTRLGWVVGAGLDWKPSQNWVFGVLYRHHEFPKGTVSFADGSNSVGFGTSSMRVDSVQGRISYHLPIH